MPRAALPSLVLAAAAAHAACEGEPPARPGPAYTPATADMIRALGADCQIQPRAEGGEVRSCRGRQSTVRVELDAAQRIRELDMMVLASTGAPEAWLRYGSVLPAVVGPAVTEAARKKLHGEPADLVVEGARVSTLIDGERYLVKLTWGR